MSQITTKDKRKEKQIKEPVSKSPTNLKKTAKRMEYINATPKGEKPPLSEFPNEYIPPQVECGWYSWWESQGLFKPNGKSDTKFVILLPPPNVTGELHLGHALACSIEDALIRYHRMIGDDTLWVPGIDHAGISTQTRVEQMLQFEKGIKRHDLSREEFLSYAHEWTDKYEKKIQNQLRALGSSIDWSHYFFTLDKNQSKAVTEAFVRLFNKKKIYRAERLVNWDCALQTAISDAEVSYITIPKKTYLKVPGHNFEKYPFGVLTYFKYQIADENGNPTSETVTIATTRLETMLGDEAIAINSKDSRYFNLHGKRIYHPFRKITIPIIIDDLLVDMDFGTGVVKVTPAHDPNDFETGLRHNLQFTNILTEDGKINNIVPEFEGMPRFDARIAIKESLEKLGLFVEEKDHEMRLGITQRGKDIVEQVIKKQWFVDTKSMAERAIKAVDDGSLEIYPSEFISDWKSWHENIRPWCISRQLWWGHRIPAYRIFIDGKKIEGENEWIAAHDQEEALNLACEKLKINDKTRIKVIQDDDVLDTWFSASLLPFSSMGWPNNTMDLSKYFPGTILETGWDILTFWVSRMVMMSLELNDTVPFKTALLHPLIRDAQGRKMSKSLGNVLNLLHIINGIELQELIDNLKEGIFDEKEIQIATAGMKASYPNGIPQLGTDAMRMALISFAGMSRVAKININVIVSYRNFCNKIWNAAKFAMKNFNGFDASHDSLQKVVESGATLSIADKWILNKLNAAIKSAIKGCENFLMNDAISSMIHFFHDDFCSVYFETIKPILSCSDDEKRKKTVIAILYECFETSLRMFHPFMPFITENLWQRLPKRFDVPSIMIAPFPSINQQLESYQTETMENAIKITSAIRKIKQAYNLKSNKIKVQIASNIPNIEDIFDSVLALAGICHIEKIPLGIPLEPGYSSEVISETIEVRLDLTGLIDFEKELKNTVLKKEKLLVQFNKLDAKIKAPNYSTKVPQNIQDNEKEIIENYRKQITSLEEIEKNLKSIIQNKA